MTWPTHALAQISLDLQPGFARQPNGSDEGLPQLRTNNVSSSGGIDLSLVKRVPASLAEIERYSLAEGDILFNNTNSRELVGKTAFFHLVDGPYLFSNHMTRIRVNRKVSDPRFVARQLHWLWKSGAFRSMVTQWVNQAAINRTALSRVPVVVPPLSEQRRIVGILDQADGLRTKRAEADTRAARILPALFSNAFGDLLQNSMNWPTASLGDITTDFKYGTSVRCDSFQAGFPVLRIPNVVGGRIELRDLKYAEFSDNEVERLRLRDGDILFVRTNGNPDYVGRCAVYKQDEQDRPVLFASYLIRARLDSTRVAPKFVAAYLRTPVGRQMMEHYIRTTAGQSNISQEGLRQIRVILPQLEIQQRFVQHIEKVERAEQLRDRAGKDLDSLFRLLLHRAFTGDLTAKWRQAHVKELLTEMEAQARALEAVA